MGAANSEIVVHDALRFHRGADTIWKGLHVDESVCVADRDGF